MRLLKFAALVALYAVLAVLVNRFWVAIGLKNDPAFALAVVALSAALNPFPGERRE